MKKVLLGIGLALLAIGGALTYGFYLMLIEDQYGDFQELFFESDPGDIILNHDAQELGHVIKTFTRIKIENGDTLDLYNWVNRNGTSTRNSIYSSSDLTDIKNYPQAVLVIENWD